MSNNNKWWWLSFAGESFLGIVIIKAPSFLEAVVASHALRCNPGGEVAGWPIVGCGDPDPKWTKRLLSREEASQMSLDWTRHELGSTREFAAKTPAVLHERENEGS